MIRARRIEQPAFEVGQTNPAVLTQLLSVTQSSFPLVHDPYRTLAQTIGASSHELFTSMNNARKQRLVRRLGPSFDSYRLGYASCLCTTKIKATEIEGAVAFINRYPHVTHNYLRDDAYNIWFTVIAHGREELERIIAEIEAHNNSLVLRLPALRLFKIRVDFNLDGKSRESYVSNPVAPYETKPEIISETDKMIIRVLQDHSFSGYYPFEDVANAVSHRAKTAYCEEDILIALGKWKERGIIRRFGTTLYHQNVGIAYNTMAVWDIPESQTEHAGKIMAAQDSVSHCYERPRVGDWQGNLYTMVHGKGPNSCNEAIVNIQKSLISRGICVERPKQLRTLCELKKTSMKYFCEE